MNATGAPALSPATLLEAIAAIVGHEAAVQAQFGVALSGGPDSLALTLLAAEAMPGRVSAVTVDHGLRPESVDEAEAAGHQCAAIGIGHHILRPTTPIAGSPQLAAREVRYALLDAWRVDQGIDWLLTGHHADDQLETMVMRLNRSSGVGGLAGIRARHGHVLRPLLGVRRADLAAVVAASGLKPVDDPSNRNPRFDRTHVRIALGESALLDAAAVATSARHLADADAALGWMVDQWRDARVTADGAALLLDTHGLPTELCRRLMVDCLARIAPDAAAPRGAALDRAIARLVAGQSAMIGNVHIAPGVAGWRFTLAPPRRPA